MPTLPSPPCKLLDDPPAHGPLERLSRNVGLVGNTAPYDSNMFIQRLSKLSLTVSTGTGHPALTIPVGFVPATDDKEVKLPAGLQIVGKKFAEIDCLKVGAAWESAYDWKAMYPGK
jgi:amidase